MALSIGIIGLPNVGKSTLFNALLKRQQALVANYPFATIEPNVGVVAVPDERLQKLAEITKNEVKMIELPPIKPATVEFVDIAGLVKGASEGAGLGNKFLSHIREVKVICHVVRAFEDPEIIREGSIDPKSDYETIDMELALADLQSLEKQRESKPVKTNPTKLSAIIKLMKGLDSGKSARDIMMTDEEWAESKDFFLLSAKPEIVVLNVSEEQYTKENIPQIVDQYSEILGIDKEKFTVICAKIESDLAALSDDEQKEYLRDMGLETSGLERLIQKAYQTLGLISFLTCGEKEVRAWTVKKGTNAQYAAGEIHTDFIKKFIKAEVISFDDFVTVNGWKKARESGKARLEGRDYIMQDGDVVEFKIGA
jgi:ribosome-binding ATPase